MNHGRGYLSSSVKGMCGSFEHPYPQFTHHSCNAVLASPDVIAGQVDVLPTERGEVRQQLIRNVHSSLAHHASS
jgi:hypothetical protein